GLGQCARAPRPDDAAGERQSALDQQAHGNRGRVPAARRQSGKQRAPRRLVIEVERLRIELAGERLDLRRIDDMGGAGETPSDREVLEIETTLSRDFMGLGHAYLPRLDSNLHDDSDWVIFCQCSTRASRTCRVRSPAASRAWANGGACSSCARPGTGCPASISFRRVLAPPRTCSRGGSTRWWRPDFPPAVGTAKSRRATSTC